MALVCFCSHDETIVVDGEERCPEVHQLLKQLATGYLFFLLMLLSQTWWPYTFLGDLSCELSFLGAF
eukprot:5186526-Amphidinium_carterae.1